MPTATPSGAENRAMTRSRSSTFLMSRTMSSRLSDSMASSWRWRAVERVDDPPDEGRDRAVDRVDDPPVFASAPSPPAPSPPDAAGTVPDGTVPAGTVAGSLVGVGGVVVGGGAGALEVGQRREQALAHGQLGGADPSSPGASLLTCARSPVLVHRVVKVRHAPRQHEAGAEIVAGRDDGHGTVGGEHAVDVDGDGSGSPGREQRRRRGGRRPGGAAGPEGRPAIPQGGRGAGASPPPSVPPGAGGAGGPTPARRTPTSRRDRSPGRGPPRRAATRTGPGRCRGGPRRGWRARTRRGRPPVRESLLRAGTPSRARPGPSAPRCRWLGGGAGRPPSTRRCRGRRRRG